MADTIKVTILADGTIRTETDPVSAPNHQSAEEFLRSVNFLSGGDGIRIPKSEGQMHQHSHSHIEQKG